MHTEERELDTPDGELGLYVARPDGHACHPEGAARSYATALTIFSEHLGSGV